jgi:hypothetical protein
MHSNYFEIMQNKAEKLYGCKTWFQCTAIWCMDTEFCF